MIKFWIILTIILTPWFWFWTPPKNLFNPETKKNIVDARLQVIFDRGKIGNSFPNILFSNWPKVFISRRMTVVMENLDIGNYFFSGHPRARLGIEERQKFFFFQFLLFLIGFFNKRIKKYAKLLLIYSAFVLIASFIFKWRGFSETIPFSLSFILMISLGLEQVFKWPKKFSLPFAVFSILEFSAFLFFYFRGLIR